MDIQEKLHEWRAKAAAGTLSIEEMKQAIQYLRMARLGATVAAEKKATSKKVISSDGLLAELEGL